MGKASSSKKVARAARAGGGSGRQAPKLGFPLALFAIVVLGSLLVVYARGTTTAQASPTLKDHWHVAYGVYVCDKFLDNLPQPAQDPQGIHTHGDGVIHIHPFTSAVTGSRANLQAYGDAVGIKFSDDGFTWPDGTEYKNGHDCNGQPAKVKVYRWSVDDPGKKPDVFTSDFGKVQFSQNRQAITIAVVPEGVEVPKPPSIPTLDNLSDVGPEGDSTTTSTPAPTGTDPSGGVVPQAGGDAGASTTAPATSDSSTTVAPGPADAGASSTTSAP